MINKGILCLVAWCAGPVWACDDARDLLLDCQVRGKTQRLEVCIAGDQVVYTYGTPGHVPELTLNRSVKTIDHIPWPGVGGTIWEVTRFHNQGYTYEVALSLDRMTDQKAPRGHLNVLQGETLLAELHCDEADTQIGLFALTDAKTSAGQCFSPQTERWVACSAQSLD